MVNENNTELCNTIITLLKESDLRKLLPTEIISKFKAGKQKKSILKYRKYKYWKSKPKSDKREKNKAKSLIESYQ